MLVPKSKLRGRVISINNAINNETVFKAFIPAFVVDLNSVQQSQSILQQCLSDPPLGGIQKISIPQLISLFSSVHHTMTDKMAEPAVPHGNEKLILA